MHPYLFFYFLGGVTFIPLTLLVTIAVLWIRLPVIDPSLPRPTDLPPPHVLLQQQKDQEEWLSNEKKALRGSTDSTSSSSTSTVTATTTTSDHSSSGGLSRRKSRLRFDQKSCHSPRGPSMVSGSLSPSRRNVDSGTESEPSEDDEEDDSLSHTPKRVSSPSLGGPPPSGRRPNVPMQADPNLNKEGYVRMTRVPRLGPATETISDLMANILFQPKNARPKDSYYAVLRYDTLFLYESDQQRDCKAVVPMNLFEVKIFPRNLPDNEVFNKEHPIQIKRKPDIIPSSSVLDNGQDEYYIFIHSPVIKEDWYLALLYASKLRKPGTKQKIQDKAQFDIEAIQNHIRVLHSDRHHEHTRWFNSFLGRIFLGVYKTKKIQNVFIQKITRKTLKLKRPSFLGEIKVRSFNIGQSIPYITRTKLHDLALNGELLAEFHLAYRGGVRVEIEVDVGLGLNSLKSVKVTVVLAVLVKSISGMMTLKVKAPPTNRFWIGFQEPPEMDIVIEPIVADKAIKLNVVLAAIESKIREAMVEAIVLPNMDDYPFFDSHGTGGIFEGDEEILPEQATDSEAESMPGRSAKSTTIKSAGGRRGSESSQCSESGPVERKQSWSSTCTDSEGEVESTPVATSPLYLNQNNSGSSTNFVPAQPIPIANTMAAKFKRFSQAHFSPKSIDTLGDSAKLNTKPTVATSIATAIRTSRSSTHLSGIGAGATKHQSNIPKLSAVASLAESADHVHSRIFSSSPSNAPSKKDSSNSLRRLATLESPISDDSESTTTGPDEILTPTGVDPAYQGASPTKAKNTSRKPEFDTFPRSNTLRRWDTASMTLVEAEAEAETGTGKGTGTKDETSMSSSSSHVGIAGILEGSRSGANTVQGNLANLFASAVEKRKKLQRNSFGSSPEDGKDSGNNGASKDHGRKNSGDGLMSLRLKKDMLMRRDDKDRDESASNKSLSSLLGGHRRRGSLPASTNKGSPDPRIVLERTGSSNSAPSSQPEGSVHTQTSNTEASSTNGLPPAPRGHSSNIPTPASNKPSLSPSVSSASSSSASSTTSSTSAFLQQKSQAAIGATKAWVKRSLEDRRMSEDDPLLSGKMQTTD
ncbi:hypothetical protein BG006_001970 [Podila minutissima]|uniref:SMP-LTD domain-containing protein n=1 Tax=Podila minutissima TaxID=64525 RepID=A0A9P5ST68_9FUNG|nr:hypothetical protein BG006_001970 [Podila minutissima]